VVEVEMSGIPRVAVLGAGPCGLAATKVLREHALSVETFEAGDHVGGQWVLGNTSGTSAAYRSLRTNTHKGMSRFSDFTLPEAWPDFPHHSQMAQWFEDYARHFGFLDDIHFRSRVIRAEPEVEGGWRVDTEAGNGGRFDALVIATGNLWDPVWPDLPGSFDGSMLHAKDYLDPADPVDCRERDVVVIGLGNTACEVAVELAGQGGARRVLLACRSGQNIIPRRVRGRLAAVPHPADPVTGLLRLLTPNLRERIFRAVFPRMVARMTRDLPTPESVGLPARPDPFDKRVVVNDEILERIAAGEIGVRSAVKSFDGSEVIFEDGSRDAVDVVIAATGYRFSTPFLPPGLLKQAGADLELYRGVMHPEHHSLFVVGAMNALCSIWPRAEQQARWIAARLTGRVALPPQARIRREAYPVLRVPFDNCQLHAARLEQDVR
jgi:cation diffusion facilitator CzcD-associated flavoprotein CzcO